MGWGYQRTGRRSVYLTWLGACHSAAAGRLRHCGGGGLARTHNGAGGAQDGETASDHSTETVIIEYRSVTERPGPGPDRTRVPDRRTGSDRRGDSGPGRRRRADHRRRGGPGGTVGHRHRAPVRITRSRSLLANQIRRTGHAGYGTTVQPGAASVPAAERPRRDRDRA
eukprot:763942-Hanusia_phi.AAC.1